MDSSPTTRASLLLRLRDPKDAEAWREFVQMYAPVIYAYARRRQFQDADAADLTQEVMRSLSRAAGGLDYDPRRGAFRAWLFTVTRNKIIDFQRQHRLGQSPGGTTAQRLLDEQPARDETDAWDLEFQRRLFKLAAEQVRVEFEVSTWQAFWQTAVEGKKAQAVATELGLSVGAVYIAKSRVQARIKDRVRDLTEVHV